MMTSKKALLDGLQEHECFLTPNNRLATYLINLHVSQKKNQLCFTPSIFPLSVWLEQQWQTLLIKGKTQGKILLTEEQSCCLWRNIVTGDPEAPLLNPRPMVEALQQGWRLLHSWSIKLEDPRLQVFEDQTVWLNWMMQYRQYLDEKNYLDPSMLIHLIDDAFRTKDLTPPSDIHLIGFLEIQPNLAQLLETLELMGSTIYHDKLENTDCKVERRTYVDSQEELHAMAEWAKAQHTKNPTYRIACVVPSLQKMRPTVEACFYETFEIDQQVTSNLPFTISGGVGLAETPIVFAALNLLTCRWGERDREQLTLLLRSPFFCTNAEDRERLALFDTEWRQKRHARATLQRLHHLLNEQLPDHKLTKGLSAFFQVEIPQSLSLGEWVLCWNNLLTSMDWPGTEKLTSAEYQAVMQWQTLLTELPKLDEVQPLLRYSEALQLLQDQCEKTLFQPESSEANIHVLGMLEAVGLPFDATWVLEMNDQQWPSAPKPHPLLPVGLQRELQMPHASVERELLFCKNVTQMLISHTKTLVFSYSTILEDSPVLPSPLIEDYREQFYPTQKILLASPGIRQEAFEDFQAPSLSKAETIRGGTGILKAQSACPFKAFATYRLKITPSTPPEIGIDPKTKGILLHHILDLFWKKVKTQHALQHLSEEEEESRLIQTCVEEAFSKEQFNEKNTVIINLSKEKLTERIKEWLLYEKERPRFHVVATEQWQTVTLGGFTLHLQVDRIDQLANGHHLLIDYKTGQVKIADWLGPRPNEPQLLLYTVAHAHPIDAIAFAVLRPDEVRFKGVKIDANDTPDCIPLSKFSESSTWATQVQAWKTELLTLINQFTEGYAAVDPKNLSNTCSYCELHAFCRIHESG